MEISESLNTPPSRTMPLMQPGQEMRRVENVDSLHQLVLEHTHPAFGTLDFTFITETPEQIRAGGSHGDGYVLGESETVEDFDAFSNGLSVVWTHLRNPIVDVDSNQPIKVTLHDPETGDTFDTFLSDDRDTVDMNKPATVMTGGDWERREDPLGDACLFLPTDPSVLTRLQVSIERIHEPIEGGDN